MPRRLLPPLAPAPSTPGEDSEWRLGLLVAIPVAALAFAFGWLLDGPSGQSTGFDRLAYPGLALGMVVLEAVLALWRRSTGLVAFTIAVSSSLFFLAKLVFVLFLAPAATHVQVEMTETFFWIPSLYILSLFIPNVRGGRLVPIVFIGSMLLVSLAYALRALSGPLDLGVLYSLGELNLANVTLLVSTHSFLGFKDRYARSQAKADTMHRLAHTDLVTGLPNRLQLEADLEFTLGRAGGLRLPASVIYLDLDGFKMVNDTLGHSTGDTVLREVGRRWRAFCREGDVIARLSGDEFVVVLWGADGDEGVAVAGRLIAALAAPMQLGGEAVQVTASAGVSAFPADAADGPTLLRHADSALYKVKRSGKNGVKRFSAALDTQVEERSLLERDLGLALARGELSLVYQPIFDLRSHTPVKAEALVRWHHPERGHVSPTAFIPIAESTGLIVPIGAWVLREACRSAHGWPEHRGRRLKVSVNVAPLQLAQADFPGLVAEALAESGLPGHRLELELTEGAVIHDVVAAGRTLRELRELGVSVAIDDFGTGYSSLSYLRDLPIDTVKIDRSFVTDLGSPRLAPQYALALIEAVLSIARTLDLEVVAEGIETEAQLEVLRGLGCHAGQGYHFARPGLPERLVELLHQAPPVGAGPAPLKGLN